MSTTDSSFDQYCISHKINSDQSAAAPGPEVRRERPNFQLCSSSQQILATPLITNRKSHGYGLSNGTDIGDLE